jgi:hypothetical protein
MTRIDRSALESLPAPPRRPGNTLYLRDTGSGPNVDDLEPVEPAYLDLFDWVFDWFLPTAERRVADGSQMGIYWCPKWWAHPEGLQRIYCLWREWEKARAEETMSQWWRDHLDHHLLALTGEHGPFTRCSPSRHHEPMHLSSHPVPEELIDLMPEGTAQLATADEESAGQIVPAAVDTPAQGHGNV